MPKEALTRVLIVEDEATMTALLRRWLVELSYEVNSAASATEALKIMLVEPAEIILCDIRMPGHHDGLWLAERVRTKWPRTKIIMASGVVETDADDALDLVQETILRAARSARSVPLGLPSEEAWLVRVLINIRRDQWRKTTIRRRHDRELNHQTSVDNDQEAVLMARATVWHALDTLTPRRRAVVVMHELEGLPISKIASLLGISAITVRWHLSTGRRDLARTLRPQMGETNENR